MCAQLPVPEALQHMVGTRALVKPRIFVSLFELTPGLRALLLPRALGHIINTPKVLQGQRAYQEHTHPHFSRTFLLL